MTQVSPRSEIFRANTADTSLSKVLTLMSSLSRNRFLVEMIDVLKRPLGSIEAKGGMVLDAEVSGLRGRAAVQALMQLGAERIVVYSLPGEFVGEPVGQLDALLRASGEARSPASLAAPESAPEWNTAQSGQPVQAFYDVVPVPVGAEPVSVPPVAARSRTAPDETRMTNAELMTDLIDEVGGHATPLEKKSAPRTWALYLLVALVALLVGCLAAMISLGLLKI